MAVPSGHTQFRETSKMEILPPPRRTESLPPGIAATQPPPSTPPSHKRIVDVSLLEENQPTCECLVVRAGRRWRVLPHSAHVPGRQEAVPRIHARAKAL